MEDATKRRMIQRTLDSGTVGTAADIRNLAAGLSSTPIDDVEALLQGLEDDGLAYSTNGTWRSAKWTSHIGSEGDKVGTQMRSLVYVPEVVPSTYLHLSFKQGSGSFRFRNYHNGLRGLIVGVPEIENDITVLRKTYRFEDEVVWSDEDAHPVIDVDFWTHEIAKLNAKRGL